MSLYHDYNRIINLDSSRTYQTVIEGNVEHKKRRKKQNKKKTKKKQKKENTWIKQTLGWNAGQHILRWNQIYGTYMSDCYWGKHKQNTFKGLKEWSVSSFTLNRINKKKKERTVYISLCGLRQKGEKIRTEKKKP